MKKQSLLLIALFLMCALLVQHLTLAVLAHPGRTDGSGGHTDRSTGDYHYHHGYPAHDHYDMDSDGDTDCPYDFNDRTDHSSVNNSGSGSNTDAVIQNGSKQNNVEPGKVSLWEIISAILEYLPGAIGIWLFISYFLFNILSLFLGTDQGCSSASIIGAIIAIIFYVLSVVDALS